MLVDKIEKNKLNIIKYIPLQQGLRPNFLNCLKQSFRIIKYIPLQQGLRLFIHFTSLIQG